MQLFNFILALSFVHLDRSRELTKKEKSVIFHENFTFDNIKWGNKSDNVHQTLSDLVFRHYQNKLKVNPLKKGIKNYSHSLLAVTSPTPYRASESYHMRM